ncbi:MAG: hypothetical protein PVF14_20550, partial [Desulfobacterales bacterium]
MGLRLKASSNHRLVWTAVFAGLWITTAALSARAMESIDAGKAFIANKLPSQQQINQSYFNFTYRPFDRKDLTFDILIPADNWRDMPPTVSPKALEQDTTQLIPL